MEKSRPSHPVVPALHYIVATAQGTAGKEGKYILRMPDSQIDEVLTNGKKERRHCFSRRSGRFE